MTVSSGGGPGKFHGDSTLAMGLLRSVGLILPDRIKDHFFPFLPSSWGMIYPGLTLNYLFISLSCLETFKNLS